MNGIRAHVNGVIAATIRADASAPLRVREIAKKAVEAARLDPAKKALLETAAAEKFEQAARSLLRARSDPAQPLLDLGLDGYSSLGGKDTVYVRRSSLGRAQWLVNIRKLMKTTALDERRIEKATALYEWGINDRRFDRDPEIDTALKGAAGTA